MYDYTIIEHDPPNVELGDNDLPIADNQYHPTNTVYERRIRFRNTGTCAWEPTTSLTFVTGEGQDFDMGPLVVLRDFLTTTDENGVSVPRARVEPGEEITVTLVGRTPSGRTNLGLQVGTWELRTPERRLIGIPFEISVWVFDPGGN
ncbi:MAG: hypothetical protein GYB67_17580 [Chloroflexi bacterium]|nr:hypothetical protein [Chloroflexota bacterium]